MSVFNQRNLSSMALAFPNLHLSDHPRIGPYWRLMRLDKPVGSLLILWPTLASLWLASDGQPSVQLVVIFTLGTFLMRSAGCAINDFADRNVDGEVERTANRPLATGELSSKNAIVCFLIVCVVAFGLVLLTNRLTIILSFVGLALALIYPFLKRVTHLPQVWLGLAMNWGIIMAYSAQANSIAPSIWLLYAATICWTVAYDTFYAMVDRDDDIRLGVKSIAILFGDQDRLMAGILQLLALLALGLLGRRFELSSAYYAISIGAVAVLFLYQQYLIRGRERPLCFRAFMNNRWVALLIFLGVAAHYLLP